MTNITSTITFPSRVLPGVTFTFRRPTAVRRAALLLASAPARQSVKTLAAEGDAVMKQGGEERQEQLTEILNQATATLTAIIQPLVIKWAWVGVAGLTIDDHAPDVEGFICNAPSPLVKECFDFASALHARTDTDVTLPLPSVGDHGLVN